MGRVEVEGAFDIFNAANSSASFNEVQTYGSSLGRPTDVIQGRIFRFGGADEVLRPGSDFRHVIAKASWQPRGSAPNARRVSASS